MPKRLGKGSKQNQPAFPNSPIVLKLQSKSQFRTHRVRLFADGNALNR